jgi:hypothetical protein
MVNVMVSSSSVDVGLGVIDGTALTVGAVSPRVAAARNVGVAVGASVILGAPVAVGGTRETAELGVVIGAHPTVSIPIRSTTTTILRLCDIQSASLRESPRFAPQTEEPSR